MPAVWNMAEPLEVEYGPPIHQSSDHSNSGRKEIEKPPHLTSFYFRDVIHKAVDILGPSVAKQGMM